jgi:peptidoglycan/LPS O-acetylase OafA/YrhL
MTKPPNKLPGLEALRFFAAAAIIIFHTTLLPGLVVPSSFSFVPTHFGNGVPLFYAVSAFGLFYGYRERLHSFGEVGEFYLRRFLRIAPLFYFMMAFYVVFLWIAFGANVPWEKVLTSALFVFNLVPGHVDGYVWASWSIGVEMLFYAMMPLLALTITSTFSAAVFFALSAMFAALWKIAFASATGDLASFSGFSLAAHLLQFAGGILALYIFLSVEKLPEPRRRTVGIVILAIAVVSVVSMTAFAGPLANTLYGALGPALNGPTIVALWALALSLLVLGISIRPLRLLVNPVTRALGRASFSLYLWHPVVIVLLDRWGVYRWMYASVPKTTLAYAGSIAITFLAVIPIALASYLLIERPGMNIYKLRRKSRIAPQPMSAFDAPASP